MIESTAQGIPCQGQCTTDASWASAGQRHACGMQRHACSMQRRSWIPGLAAIVPQLAELL